MPNNSKELGSGAGVGGASSDTKFEKPTSVTVPPAAPVSVNVIVSVVLSTGENVTSPETVPVAPGVANVGQVSTSELNERVATSSPVTPQVMEAERSSI